MSWLRNIFSTLVLITSSIAFAQELQMQDQDLTDYMTPRELMQEIGVNPEGILWKASAANPRLVLVVDRAEKGTSATAQTLEVYLDDQMIQKFKVSTGKESRVTTPTGTTYFATTPTGEFRIYARNRFHKSKKWNGAEMNFAQFFNGGIAVHATTPMHYDALGSRDSGGCVRLHPKNAEIVWEMVGKMGITETKVIVFDGTKQPHPLGFSQGTDYYEPVPLPTPRRTPKATPTPPVTRYDEPRYEVPRYEPYPHEQGYVPAPPMPPQRREVYPTTWAPSANPTPPPIPPPGYQDTYPYCYAGYWCPRPARR